MSIPLFDLDLRRLRRDRALRGGPAMFLLDRVFDDALDRIALVNRRWDRALLLGCPDPAWPERLRAIAGGVDVADPGPGFAAAAGGTAIVEEAWQPEPGRYDLCLAIGTLDTVNDLGGALLRLRFALREDSLLLGTIAGGDTLPVLRAAMRAADADAGVAMPHVHPRIEAAGFANLLTAAGFVMPVVDVDRVTVRYSDLADLIRDLRGMAATNQLLQRPRTGLSRRAWAAASRAFAEAGDGDRTAERFEAINFTAWTPV